jgi:hypothetical protein
MSEPRASTGGAELQSHAISHRRRDELILIGLTILAIIGIAITDFDRYYGLRYWLIMVPVFAGASIFAGWSRARAEGENPTRILRLQAFHWLASALAVYLVYLLQITGRMNKEAAGLVTLLTIALGTFLAGVHFSWRFCVLGGILFLTVVAAAFLETFFWVFLIPALIAGAAMVLVKRNKAGDIK